MKSLRLWYLLLLFLPIFNSCDSCKNDKGSSIEPTSFEIELHTSQVELLPNQKGEITLIILSNDNKAASLEYYIDKLEVTHGKLFIDGTDDDLMPGVKLKFGPQKLVFEPSKQGGDATIKLTVVNSEGHASDAKIDIKVMDVRLDWQVDTANLSAHEDVPISLKVSSSYQKAQTLTYTIKEFESIKGTLVFDESGEEVKAGDALIYGIQKLVFRPSGDLGEATIKLSVISNEGHEVSTTFALNTKPIDFQLSMQSPVGNAFVGQDSKVLLDIFSDKKEAKKLTYTVKEITLTQGTLVFESSGKDIKTGDTLIYGTQNLIFKPSGELGEATIILTVVSSEGEEKTASLTLEVKSVGFSLNMRSNKKSIFSNQEVEIELKIEANYRDWRSPSLTFYFKDAAVSFGSLISKITKKEVKEGEPIELNYLGQRLNFDPMGKTGEATIILTVVSSEGEEKTASVTINVQTVDFVFTMKSNQDHLFAHQKAIISLQSQIDVWMAPNLSYTLKEVEVSFGALTFKDTGKTAAPGDAIELDSFYKESLIFDPMEKTGEATIKITVVSSEEIERNASVTINIVPIDFDVTGSAGVDIYTERWPNPEYKSTIEIQVINKKYGDTSLDSGPWNIIGWSFSDGLKRKIMYPSVFYYKDKLKILNKDEDGKELVEFPIPINRDGKIRFCIDIDTIKIDKAPKISFFIQGAQGTIREVEISLEKAQGMALAVRVGAYTELAQRISKQIEEFLPGGWRCHRYTASSEQVLKIRQLSQEAGELLDQFEQVRKELSQIDQWWKGPSIRSLIALNNGYGKWAIDDLNTLIEDMLPQLFTGKTKLDYLYGIK